MNYWDRITLSSLKSIKTYFKSCGTFDSNSEGSIQIDGGNFRALAEFVDEGETSRPISQLILLVYHLALHKHISNNELIIGYRDLSRMLDHNEPEFLPHCSYIEGQDYLEDVFFQVQDISRAIFKNYETFKLDKLIKAHSDLDCEMLFPFELEVIEDFKQVEEYGFKKTYGCRLSLLILDDKLIIYYKIVGCNGDPDFSGPGINIFLEFFTSLLDEIVADFDRTVSDTINVSKHSVPNTSIIEGKRYDDLASRIKKIWGRTIGNDSIFNGNDNFFDVGGGSLDVFRVVNAIRKEFDVTFTIHDFLTGPTIAELVGLVNELSENNTQSVLKLIDLDLEAEVSKITDEILIDSLFFPTKEVDRALLTGSTGFLGVFLLAELLKKTNITVICLIRASSLAEGKAKLSHALQSYQTGYELYDIEERVKVVIGDISKSNLGLSDEVCDQLSDSIDIVYHNAANVNAFYPYFALKPDNVDSVKHIVHFAIQHKVKPIHFISTPNVLESQMDGFEVPLHSGLLSGYAQSKWVAEHILVDCHKRGLPVVIYRPNLIVGHSKTGACKVTDLFYQELRYSIKVKKYPEKSIRYNLVPVDFVAESIIKKSLDHKSYGKSFHLVSRKDSSSEELVDLISRGGANCELVADHEWISSVEAYIDNDISGNDHELIGTMIKRELFQTPSASATLEYKFQGAGGVDSKLTCNDSTILSYVDQNTQFLRNIINYML